MPKDLVKLTERQDAGNKVLGGEATHCLLYGGSRSGKTFLIVRAIVMRAMAVDNSRHLMVRFRFNHIKSSIVFDTLPKVMELCFPGVATYCKLDKTDWYYTFPNGSEIWFGGLDDKQRTEKVLGNEYASIFLNECSQITWASRNIVKTRLAQQTSLRLRMYYDCNPPADSHWTCKAFVKKIDPDTRVHFTDLENYACMGMNPTDNLVNLPAGYLAELESLPERMRRRFLLGEFVPAIDGALWSLEMLDKHRTDDLPDMRRIIIAVDPSGCSGDEDVRSDEVGIIVGGLGDDGRGYVLEDLSGRFSPEKWGRIVGAAFDRWDADCVVAETNFGGAMVQQVIKAARPRTPFRAVKASRGKHVRAEPVAVLFERGDVCLGGHFIQLEDQLCSFSVSGYLGDRSPDRADAMVWAISDLFPGIARRERRGKRTMQTQTESSYSLHGW